MIIIACILIGYNLILCVHRTTVLNFFIHELPIHHEGGENGAVLLYIATLTFPLVISMHSVAIFT